MSSKTVSQTLEEQFAHAIAYFRSVIVTRIWISFDSSLDFVLRRMEEDLSLMRSQIRSIALASSSLSPLGAKEDTPLLP